MEEELNVEAECKNCNHAVYVHTPKCTAKYDSLNEERICGCEKPQYYGALISNKYLGSTEFHCNNCGRLIGFLNSIDENIYETIQDEAILCINCISSIKNTKDKKDLQDITYNNNSYQCGISIVIVSKESITVPIASVANINGKPILNYLLKQIQ